MIRPAGAQGATGVPGAMQGLTVAAVILASHSAAVALLVYGAAHGYGLVMNLCWIGAIGLLYAPPVLAMRAARRPV